MTHDEETTERLPEKVAELERCVAEQEARIAELQAIKKALDESERRLRTLMSNLPGIAYRCKNDADWTMEFVSEGCLALTGYRRDALIRNRAVSYGNLIHPDDRQSVWTQVESALAQRRRYQLEYRIRTADGREKWVWEQGTGVFSEEGPLIALEGFITDITERKQAEEELRKSRVMLQATIESLPFDFFALGPDGRYTIQNATSKAHWGDAVGKTPHEVSSEPDDLAVWLDNNQRAFAGERVEAEVPMTLAGEKRTFWNIVTPIRSGAETYGILGMNIDITERKQAEHLLRRARDLLEQKVGERTAELATANQQLQAIYDGMADGLLIADALTGRSVRANPAMCRMLGYSEAELRSLSMADVHPCDRLPELMKKAEAHVRESSAQSENIPMLRKDGSIFYVDIDSSHIEYDGKPCVLSFFRDITQRRRAHEALKRERHNLERMLQASDHERRLIAYEIHDGLAQQIAGALMQLDTYQYIKQSAPEEAAAAYQAGVTMLRQSHAEVRRLISGVRPPILDESGVVAAIAHLVHADPFVAGPQIEFRSRVNFTRLAPVVENSIYRIVQEGLTNAWKHSQSDQVRISLVEHGDKIRIGIRDRGRGFDPKAAGDDRFGLAGIRERARLLGGKSSIRSTPGKGTRIVVELPLVPKQ